jgi:hypothetical protein
MRFALALMLLALPGLALSQEVCKVTDPTGTPLNVREKPQGKIVGTIRNGKDVVPMAFGADQNGNYWILVADEESGKEIGWVFREFVSCYRK